jgi:hypothetical protein
LGVLAMALLTLEESDRLSKLLDIAQDDMGLALSVNDLPQRVRPKQQRRSKSQGEQLPDSANPEPEAF